MPTVMTNPKHLFFSERVAACSDAAQMHYPRMLLSANTLSRSELSPGTIRRTCYATIRNPPSDEELSSYQREYFQNHLLFIYADPETGSLWGQWLVPQMYQTNYQTADDKRTPAPDEKQIEAYRQSYYDEKQRKLKTRLDISELFQNSAKVKSRFGFSELPEVVPLVVVDVHTETNTLSASADASGDFIKGKVGKPDGPVAVPAKSSWTSADYLDWWNAHCAPLPKIREITKKRGLMLTGRVRDGSVTPEKFKQALAMMVASPQCRGEGKQGWRATFDWLIEDDTNIAKVLEGAYPEKKAKPLKQPAKPMEGLSELIARTQR